MKSYTLKIRGGVEVDSYGKKAGKGALIQEEKSATLGVSQDQILFQAVKASGNNKPCVAYGVTTNLILDDQGGQQISVRTDGKSPTLRAEMHGNQPCVLTFEPGIASRVGGHVYENISGTLRATPGDNQMAIVLENHPNDSRVRIDDSGTIQTLTSRCGTGGGNVPMVMQKVICLQGNGIDRADTAGCNGKGWTEDVSYTLNTIDRHAVAYCMETFHCNTEEEKTPPIKARDYKDPLVICYEKTKK